MITQGQCALLFIGLGVLIGITVYLSHSNDRAIESSRNPDEATTHLVIGVALLVVAYFVLTWWSDQFQPGSMFLP